MCRNINKRVDRGVNINLFREGGLNLFEPENPIETIHFYCSSGRGVGGMIPFVRLCSEISLKGVTGYEW